jgi:hypothetical protein
MAVTITLKGRNRDTGQPYVSFPEEVSEYLSKLGFKYLKDLSLKDPYEEVTLERDLLSGLKADLKAVQTAIRDQSIAPPPAAVDLEGDEEQFGWKGLASFAERFLRLIDDAEKTGGQIIWIGD